MVIGVGGEVAYLAGGDHADQLVKSKSVFRRQLLDVIDIIFPGVGDRFLGWDIGIGHVPHSSPVVEEQFNGDLVLVGDIIIAGSRYIWFGGAGDIGGDQVIDVQFSLLVEEHDRRAGVRLGCAGAAEVSILGPARHIGRSIEVSFGRNDIHRQPAAKIGFSRGVAFPFTGEEASQGCLVGVVEGLAPAVAG